MHNNKCFIKISAAILLVQSIMAFSMEREPSLGTSPRSLSPRTTSPLTTHSRSYSPNAARSLLESRKTTRFSDSGDKKSDITLFALLKTHSQFDTVNPLERALESGANVNETGYYGCTPLMWVLLQDHNPAQYAVAYRLLTRSHNLLVRNRFNMDTWDCCPDKPELKELLKQCGVAPAPVQVFNAANQLVHESALFVRNINAEALGRLEKAKDTGKAAQKLYTTAYSIITNKQKLNSPEGLRVLMALGLLHDKTIAQDYQGAYIHPVTKEKYTIRPVRIAAIPDGCTHTITLKPEAAPDLKDAAKGLEEVDLSWF